MSKPLRFSALAWLIVPIAAGAFLFWMNGVWRARVEHTSSVAEAPVAPSANGEATTTAETTLPAVRRLIVPEHNTATYHWLAQTRQMFAHGEWRVRQIDYENAPNGREVRTGSLYRWWLGAVVWGDHVISGRSIDASLEHAALYADPLLHLLLLVGATAFVAWRFGSFSALLLSIGLVTIFPFATEFLPGAPDERGLAQALAFASLLPLLAGVAALHGATDADVSRVRREARRWFVLAGVLGGCGLWVNVSVAVPVIGGVAVGALIAAWVARIPAAKKSSGARVVVRAPVPVPAAAAAAAPVPISALVAVPWLAWAISGAATSLVAYVIEYFPADLLSWKLRFNHPFYALAWLGLGVLLVPATSWIAGRKPWTDRRSIIFLTVRSVLAIAAIATIPILMWKVVDAGWVAVDASSFRLTKLWDGAVASSLSSWIDQVGLRPRAMVTLLPLVLIIPAVWVFALRATGPALRSVLAVAFGPVIVALALTWRPLQVWSGLDGTVLALLVATTAAISHLARADWRRWLWPCAVALVLVPGVVQFFPPTDAEGKPALTKHEVDGLIERDLARWLSNHVGKVGGVVLAPPDETITMYYYGGLRGLASLTWENRSGLEVAVRIVSASTPEEAQELMQKRGVTHIIMPSWDTYLDIYARMGMGQMEGTFQNRLNFWKLPAWLKPVPYAMPVVPGFEGQAVTIFEMVEDQEDAPALSRIAEYFVEMGQRDRALSAAQALRRFPADVGALVARAMVEIDYADGVTFTRTFDSLVARLAAKGDRYLPWDRRVSLAVILYRKQKTDLAREQATRCFKDATEERVRSLTTGSLYKLQALGKAFELTFEDPATRELALELLPPEARARLAR